MLIVVNLQFAFITLLYVWFDWSRGLAANHRKSFAVARNAQNKYFCFGPISLDCLFAQLTSLSVFEYFYRPSSRCAYLYTPIILIICDRLELFPLTTEPAFTNRTAGPWLNKNLFNFSHLLHHAIKSHVEHTNIVYRMGSLWTDVKLHVYFEIIRN